MSEPDQSHPSDHADRALASAVEAVHETVTVHTRPPGAAEAARVGRRRRLQVVGSAGAAAALVVGAAVGAAAWGGGDRSEPAPAASDTAAPDAEARAARIIHDALEIEWPSPEGWRSTEPTAEESALGLPCIVDTLGPLGTVDRARLAAEGVWRTPVAAGESPLRASIAWLTLSGDLLATRDDLIATLSLCPMPAIITSDVELLETDDGTSVLYVREGFSGVARSTRIWAALSGERLMTFAVRVPEERPLTAPDPQRIAEIVARAAREGQPGAVDLEP